MKENRNYNQEVLYYYIMSFWKDEKKIKYIPPNKSNAVQDRRNSGIEKMTMEEVTKYFTPIFPTHQIEYQLLNVKQKDKKGNISHGGFALANKVGMEFGGIPFNLCYYSGNQYDSVSDSYTPIPTHMLFQNGRLLVHNPSVSKTQFMFIELHGNNQNSPAYDPKNKYIQAPGRVPLFGKFDAQEIREVEADSFASKLKLIDSLKNKKEEELAVLATAFRVPGNATNSRTMNLAGLGKMILDPKQPTKYREMMQYMDSGSEVEYRAMFNKLVDKGMIRYKGGRWDEVIHVAGQPPSYHTICIVPAAEAARESQDKGFLTKYLLDADPAILEALETRLFEAEKEVEEA